MVATCGGAFMAVSVPWALKGAGRPQATGAGRAAALPWLVLLALANACN